jgi:two-component system, chemotaxis family, chemotaxis protein CheY
MARILVIDDDPLSRDYVKQILQSEGHAVEMADSGQSGLAAFHACPADLVITDMVMPETDGVELIAGLMKEHPRLPVIAMSGAPSSAQYLYLASYLGAEKMMTKPFTAKALLAAVTSALKPAK